jgi:hypothetical protein
LRDFTDLCRELDLRVDACVALSGGKPARPIRPDGLLENWRSETALFLLSRRSEDAAEAPPRDLFGAVALEPAAPAKPARRAKPKR